MKRKIIGMFVTAATCFIMGGALFQPIGQEKTVLPVEHRYAKKSAVETAISRFDGEDELREEIVDYALKFVGNPYVYGGTSLTNGTDCSGFTMSVYKNFGITINRVSRDQVDSGTVIKRSELQKGDLVFYGSGGRINHVAMYMGNGKVVHASNPSSGIKTSDMDYRTPYKYVSIL